MKPFNVLFILFLMAAVGTLTTSCLIDAEKYRDFACEQFGGDFDGDGVCSRNDCNDFNPFIYAGAPCDDGDDLTENDMINAECECEGV